VTESALPSQDHGATRTDERTKILSSSRSETYIEAWNRLTGGTRIFGEDARRRRKCASDEKRRDLLHHQAVYGIRSLYGRTHRGAQLSITLASHNFAKFRDWNGDFAANAAFKDGSFRRPSAAHGSSRRFEEHHCERDSQQGNAGAKSKVGEVVNAEGFWIYQRQAGEDVSSISQHSEYGYKSLKEDKRSS